jgi:hypothetical protein
MFRAKETRPPLIAVWRSDRIFHARFAEKSTGHVIQSKTKEKCRRFSVGLAALQKRRRTLLPGARGELWERRGIVNGWHKHRGFAMSAQPPL